MSVVNTAIIGCGRIHLTHAEAINKNPLLKLAAVVDIERNRAIETSLKYNCDYYTDYKEMLKNANIDVVHICTPHYLHAEMAIAAMKSGKNVLIEKPMAIKPEDAEEMIRVSESTGMKLGVCFQNRYNDTSKWIKEFLKTGTAGHIIGARAFVTWHRDKSYYASGLWRGTWDMEGGGVLINQAIHTLDLLQWFIGDIAEIKASVDTRLLEKVIEVEDTAEATIKFTNGAIALFYATNCYTSDPPVEIELHCENATIKLEDDIFIKYKNGETEYIPNPSKALGDKAYWGLCHEALIDDFYCNIADKRHRFAVDGQEGIKAVKIIQAIYASQENKKYIRVN